MAPWLLDCHLPCEGSPGTKGALKPAWEQVVQLPPSCEKICPLRLLLQYVNLTRTQCAPGTLLFRMLQPPFQPVTANTLGSITKKYLQTLGFQLSGFGPHSTRGAGVKLFKSMGMNSEEVCELGKWKNPTAFTAHYLRLGSAKSVSKKFGADRKSVV